MSIYVLMEYIEECKLNHEKATVQGLYTFKELWEE